MEKSITSEDREIEKYLRENKLFPNTSAPWQQKILNELLSNIKISKNNTCLDLACGIGNNIETITNYFNNIKGTDRSAEAIKFVKYRHGNLNKINIDFSVDDIFMLSSKKEQFDCIVCTEAMEHINNYQKAIDNIFLATKNKGYVIISFQNHFNLTAIYKYLFEKIYKRNWDVWGTHNYEHGYENYLNCFEMRKAVKNSGFMILKEIGADYINAWLFWIPFLYKNYKILNKYPMLILGKIPIIKYFGMDYFMLLKKK